MPNPKLSKEDVAHLIPNCTVFGEPMCGGQKIVFPCIINEKKYAVKFILISNTKEESQSDQSEEAVDEAKARALREIAIMKDCVSEYMVNIGEIDLQEVTVNDQKLIYYSEEWIEGNDLKDILREEKKISVEEVLKIGLNIAKAIKELWNKEKVHRDIKPQNIMRKSNGNYILLDLGLAFDLQDKSLTQFGLIPGTRMYLSPEQLDYVKKRDLDFRSDLFNLGIVMYESITGIHPFYKPGMTDNEIFFNIINKQPESIQSIDPSIPKQVCDIIFRLLSKTPSGRYRKCDMLISHLEKTLDEVKEMGQ